VTQDVWLIAGIPGVGKTTTARALTARLPKSAHIEGDTVNDFIISYSTPRDEEAAIGESERMRLNRRNQCVLARSFAENGFVPVIDYVVFTRKQVDEYLGHLKSLSLHLISLMPGPAAVLERDKARPNIVKSAAADWIHLDPIMREELKGMGLWIDNATLSVDATVDHILANQDKALVRA